MVNKLSPAKIAKQLDFANNYCSFLIIQMNLNINHLASNGLSVVPFL